MAWGVPLKNSELLLHGCLLLVASWAQRGSRVLPWLLLQRSIRPLEKPALPVQLHHFVNLSHKPLRTKRQSGLSVQQTGRQMSSRGIAKSIFSSGFTIGLKSRGSQKTQNKSIGRRWWGALVKDCRILDRTLVKLCSHRISSNRILIEFRLPASSPALIDFVLLPFLCPLSATKPKATWTSVCNTMG